MTAGPLAVALAAALAAGCAPAAAPPLAAEEPSEAAHPPPQPEAVGLVLREAAFDGPWGPAVPDTTGWDASALPDGTPLRLGRALLALGPGDVVRAAVGSDPYTGALVIEIKLAPRAAKAFHALTAARVNRPLAVVLDGRVLTAPTVNEPISGGRVQISGTFRRAEAEAVAAAVREATAPSPRAPSR